MDALSILAKFGIELQGEELVPRYNPREILACCPFHQERTPSFYLHLNDLCYYCFGCGASGFILDVIEALSNLGTEAIRKALKEELPDDYQVKPSTRVPPRYLSPFEVEVLSWYIWGLSKMLLGKTTLPGSPLQPCLLELQSYVRKRGWTMEAVEYFHLGGNIQASWNLGKPKRDQLPPYWDWLAIQLRVIGIEYHQAVEALEALGLINARKGDYWFRPAIIIPYGYRDETFWAEARILPQYLTPDFHFAKRAPKYMGMRGVAKAGFFHEDALEEFSELFVVEGAANAISLWCNGWKNVVSFGSKQGLNDDLISRLWGKDIILYFDTDKNDPEQKALSQAIEKIIEVATSVRYFDLDEGEDPNSVLLKDKSIFVAALAKMVEVSDPLDWQAHEVQKRSDKPTVISLAQAQQANQRFLSEMVDNLPSLAGKKILVNTPVGTAKTHCMINGINQADIPTLVSVSQHNLAQTYMAAAETRSKVHLYGVTHPAVECLYLDVAERLIPNGYSTQFKMDYCHGICEKASTCLHLQSHQQAKNAQLLVGMHAHTEMLGFLKNHTYGNHQRRLVVMDEAANLVREIWFTERDIEDNLKIFRRMLKRMSIVQFRFSRRVIDDSTGKSSEETSWISRELAKPIEHLIKVLSEMQQALKQKDEYRPPVISPLSRLLQSSIARKAKANPDWERIPRFMLNELVYALNRGFLFHAGFRNGASGVTEEGLFYIWRPEFHPQATTFFLSATTSKSYLENQIGSEVAVVFGDEFYVKRENLHTVQLVNLSGSRCRLMNICSDKKLSEGDKVFRENLQTFFRLVLEKHSEHRIILITSLGKKSTDGKLPKGWAKHRVIQSLQDTATAYNRTLVPVETIDLESERQFLKSQIPVLHFGLIGTNLFADFEVAIDLNAHRYSPEAIIEAVQTEYGLQLDPEKFVKEKTVFKTLDKEYEVWRWVYQGDYFSSEEYAEFLSNNSEADMIQVEGRILRGLDVPKWIYRLHNVNVQPYADAVYKSWEMLFKKEFGMDDKLRGTQKEVWEWIRQNAHEREFDTNEIVNALGGYRRQYQRALAKLVEMGYLSMVSQGGEGSNQNTPSRFRIRT